MLNDIIKLKMLKTMNDMNSSLPDKISHNQPTKNKLLCWVIRSIVLKDFEPILNSGDVYVCRPYAQKWPPNSSSEGAILEDVNNGFTILKTSRTSHLINNFSFFKIDFSSQCIIRE